MRDVEWALVLSLAIMWVGIAAVTVLAIWME